MIIKAIAFSKRGMDLGMDLSFKLKEGPLGAEQVEFELERCPEGGLSAWTEKAWQSSDALIFIGSCGIAVRAVAPHVKKKTVDPAVIVIDELGTYAIPLLSGHIGGANDLAVKIGRAIGALPVVTTATDINGLFAADDWARSQGLVVANPEKIKWVSSRILAGEKLKIKSLYEIEGELPSCLEYADAGYDILVSHRSRGSADALRLVPRVVTLGVGCHRNIELDALEEAFDAVIAKSGVHREAVFQAASLDLKKDEPALIEFCKRHGFPFLTYTAGELTAVPGDYSGSEFVKKITGVDNVCERAAVLASGGRLINKKEAGNGITMALALKEPVLKWEDK
jgi:cobalt-precorrin 5A hydrolase